MCLGVAGNRYASGGEVVSLRSGIARVKGLEDLVEQGFGLRLKFLEAVFVFLPKSDMIIKNFRFYTKK